MSETEFKVGEGGTYQIGSDRYPVTIRRVLKTKIEATFDRVLRPGMFEPDEQGERITFTRRDNGRWLRAGSTCGSLRAGREHRMDPCF